MNNSRGGIEHFSNFLKQKHSQERIEEEEERRKTKEEEDELREAEEEAATKKEAEGLQTSARPVICARAPDAAHLQCPDGCHEARP